MNILLLRDMLSEDTRIENRIVLTRVEVLLESTISLLEKKQQEKLAVAYADLKVFSEDLNQTPYTMFNSEHWKYLRMMLIGKVAEVLLVLEDIKKNNKTVDCRPLMLAVEGVLTY